MLKSKLSCFFCILFFLPFILFAQDVLINEVMSANQNTLTDEDGDTSDWIELYNAGVETVDLTGFSLSDDSLDLQKWIFQNNLLAPGEYLLIFASDKNRQGENLHTNFRISADGEKIILSDTSGLN